MSMYPARCVECGHALYANTHEEGHAIIPGPIEPSFTTDDADEPGYRVSECPECGGELEVAVKTHECRFVRARYGRRRECNYCGRPEVVSQQEIGDGMESDRQAARDGYNPNY